MPMTVSPNSLCLCSTWSTGLTLFASYFGYLTLVNFPYSKIETLTSICYRLSTGSCFFGTRSEKSLFWKLFKYEGKIGEVFDFEYQDLKL